MWAKIVSLACAIIDSHISHVKVCLKKSTCTYICDVKNTCINNKFPIEHDAKTLTGH